MTANECIPAAQYLRMSTEHQQYSMSNQSQAVEAYAKSRGFQIVRTYSDAARSGLSLKHRQGLKQLLQDVTSGVATFQTILVYDVSRWGRFQDADEAAHYEFLCKSAGIPVQYCAELFANDNSLPSLIMKALKRTMASEYSRELSAKVFNGHQNLARLGFKQGGAPGFGLRRMLIGPDQEQKFILNKGDRKSLSSDRVILVPGPQYEVLWVRRIYSLLIDEHRTPWWITGELNRQSVERPDNKHRWRYQAVVAILTHPKYMGCNVYGRSSQKLGTAPKRVPESQWIVTPAAYEPVVSKETFAEAQAILRNRTVNITNEGLLTFVRAILSREGRLSQSTIAAAPEFRASVSILRDRFGSLRNAYKMIGYGNPEDFGRVDLRRRSFAIRDQFIARLQETFPGKLTLIQRHCQSRPRLRLPSGLHVSVHISRSLRLPTQKLRWYFAPLRSERHLITLVVRLDALNEAIMDMFVLPRVVRSRLFWMKYDDEWLNRGTRLDSLGQFLEVIEAARLSRLVR